MALLDYIPFVIRSFSLSPLSPLTHSRSLSVSDYLSYKLWRNTSWSQQNGQEFSSECSTSTNQHLLTPNAELQERQIT